MLYWDIPQSPINKHAPTPRTEPSGCHRSPHLRSKKHEEHEETEAEKIVMKTFKDSTDEIETGRRPSTRRSRKSADIFQAGFN
jgi:hypothetical protein